MKSAQRQEQFLFDSYYVNMLFNILHIIYSYMINKSPVRFFPKTQFYLHVLFFGCEVPSFCCNKGDFMKRRDDFCAQI